MLQKPIFCNNFNCQSGFQQDKPYFFSGNGGQRLLERFFCFYERHLRSNGKAAYSNAVLYLTKQIFYSESSEQADYIQKRSSITRTCGFGLAYHQMDKQMVHGIFV